MTGSVTGEDALAALIARENPEQAARQAEYHKAQRRYLGLANGEVEELVAEWRAALDLAGRVALADALWRSDIFEARIGAAKLLTQARIAEDGAVWALIASWVPEFDSAAIADHAAAAGARRLSAAPERLDEVETWLRSENLWARRAALSFTMPWARMSHPDEAGRAWRERALGWAAKLVADRNWFIQKAIATWLRTLSKHEPERAQAFLAEHGASLKTFARRDAEAALHRRAAKTGG